MKIIIADDHPIIRNGVIQIIKDTPIGNYDFLEANTFQEAIDLLINNPDVELMILDIKMPGMNTIQPIHTLREFKPDLKVLMFSSYEEHLHAHRYYNAGADGYLQKDCDESEIQQAVKAILNNEKYFSKSILETIQNQHKLNTYDNPIAQLSNRELQVAQLMISGLGNLEIANELDLRESTISTYKNRIYEKLGVHSITDLFQLFQDYSNHQ